MGCGCGGGQSGPLPLVGAITQPRRKVKITMKVKGDDKIVNKINKYQGKLNLKLSSRTRVKTWVADVAAVAAGEGAGPESVSIRQPDRRLLLL